MADPSERYELLERLGVGGMAEVFRARMVGPAGFQKVVALKRILEDLCSDQDFLHRFIDEARLTARLQHPNICQVLDFGVMGDRYYLTLEYVAGLDLAKVIGRLEYIGELLEPAICLQVITGVLRGLGHAHRAVDEQGQRLGIVHRDVSPQNVLLSINGDIKLSDFGAAKANAAVRAARTQENIALGKLAYMAPEQRMGRAVDERSDIYGTGVLLAEMLLGPNLFRRSTGLMGASREQLVAGVDDRFPSALAPRLVELIGRAVDKNPERRYGDALSMLAAVEQCALELGHPSSLDRLGDRVRVLMDDEERAMAGGGEPSSPHRPGRGQVPEPHCQDARGELSPFDEGPLGLATAATELASAALAEDLSTQVISVRAEPLAEQQRSTQVIHEGPRPFEELATSVHAGAASDVMEDLATQIHRGSREIPREPRHPRPPPPAPPPRATPPPYRAPTSTEETTRPQRTDAAEVVAAQPVIADAPPLPLARAASRPPWTIEAVAEGPTPARPPPDLGAPADRPAAPQISTSEPHAASRSPSDASRRQVSVARGAPSERPAVVRRPGRRLKVQIIVMALAVASVLALVGASYLLSWQAERSRAPFPILRDPPPTTAGALPQTSPDDGGAGTGAARSQGDGAEGSSPTPGDGGPSPRETADPERADGPRPPRRQRTPTPVKAALVEPERHPVARPTGKRSASLTIIADPPGPAYVDGRLVGSRTPVRGVEVAPGSHQVRVVFSSTRESVSRQVTLRAGEHQVVRFGAEP